MENNFIQMAASADHAVAYAIGPIFKHITDCVQLYFTNGFTNIRCVTRSAVLLKPNIANILLQFFEQKFVQRGPITTAIDCNALLILEEKWPNSAFGPKSKPNSNSFSVRQLFNVCVRVFCAPNATILLVYITAKIKMSFI